MTSPVSNSITTLPLLPTDQPAVPKQTEQAPTTEPTPETDQPTPEATPPVTETKPPAPETIVPTPEVTDPSTTPTPNPTETAPAIPDEIVHAPPVFPGIEPVVNGSGVSWQSMLIAASAIVLSLLILTILVRRRPATLPPAQTPSVAAGRTAAADVLDGMVRVGEAMIDAGYPVTVVRSALVEIATTNHKPSAEAVVLPTALIVSVDDGEQVFTRAVSAGHRSYLLYQVDELDRVVSVVRSRQESARWVYRQLARIGTLPAPFTRVQRLAGYLLLSAGISVLLGASWAGVAVAAILGVGVGALLLLSERVPATFQVLVTVGASLTVSLAVFLIVRTSLDLGVLPSLVAPLVILLPGGLLTTGVIELATGHYMAGGARLAAGGMRLVLLSVGIVAAAAIIGVPEIDLSGARYPLGSVAPWVAVAVFGLGIAVQQCARPSSIGWIMLVLYVAYGAQVLGGVLFGGVLSALIGAAAMTPVAVIVARQRTGPPAIVSFLPAFWLLVPGALGLVGVTAVLDGDSTGLATLVTTVATMVAIALGVLIGLAATSSLHSKKAAAREPR